MPPRKAHINAALSSGTHSLIRWNPQEPVYTPTPYNHPRHQLPVLR